MKNTKYQNQTTSYSIAHYILIFMLVCIGIVLVAWLLIAAGYRYQAQQAISDDNVIVMPNETTPCAQSVMNQVAQVWAYDPNKVPQKYWEMAVDYLNGTVDTWTEGSCNDIRFICNPGQVRRDCDPCAVSTAMSMAMQAHTNDMIAKKCPNQ